MNGVLTSKRAPTETLRTPAAKFARFLAATFAFAGLFCTTGCMSYAAEPNGQTATESVVVTPGSISFGSVGVGSSATQTVIVSNHSAEAVTLTNVSATGAGFSVAGFPGISALRAGQTLKLTAAFKPKSAGEQMGSISVTLARRTEPVTAKLSGMGSTSKLSMTPSTVDFGNVSVGSPVSQTLKLTNEGSESVKIKSASASGAGFSMSGLSTPQTITPKQSVNFTAKFDPEGLGSKTGAISVTVDGGSEDLSLSGVGVSSRISLTASAASITFGNVKVGSKVTQTVVLKSTGNSSVNISTISVEGSGYTLSGVSSNTVLDPGQSATLSVSFDPKATGSQPATVTISSDAPTPKMNIALTGAGTSGQQSLVELKWDETPSSKIVGYFIYRSLKSGKSYSQLNSQPDSATSYTDNTVTDGQSYVYVVTSVNSSGVQSAFSTAIDVNIPAN